MIIFYHYYYYHYCCYYYHYHYYHYCCYYYHYYYYHYCCYYYHYYYYIYRNQPLLRRKPMVLEPQTVTSNGIHNSTFASCIVVWFVCTTSSKPGNPPQKKATASCYQWPCRGTIQYPKKNSRRTLLLVFQKCCFPNRILETLPTPNYSVSIGCIWSKTQTVLWCIEMDVSKKHQFHCCVFFLTTNSLCGIKTGSAFVCPIRVKSWKTDSKNNIHLVGSYVQFIVFPSFVCM